MLEQKDAENAQPIGCGPSFRQLSEEGNYQQKNNEEGSEGKEAEKETNEQPQPPAEEDEEMLQSELL